VALILQLLYADQRLSDKPVTDIPPAKLERNRAIYERYLRGEKAADLAREFGVSVRRINKLIRRFESRGF
jgi:Mor family transcriptional regulator